MSFVPNQILSADLIQLLLANRGAALNLSLLNPVNPLLGANHLLGTLPIPEPTPQPFQFLPPLPPLPSISSTSILSTPLPANLFPLQTVVKTEEPTIKIEPNDPQASTSKVEDVFEMGTIPTSTYYPTHFMRGTQLHVANGSIKKVEDLSSDDFLRCASESDDVTVNASIVKSISVSKAGSVTIVFEVGADQDQIPLKCQIEHPFFVLGKGWSSCNPRKSGENYGLDCELLQIDDVCVILTRTGDEITECSVDIVTAERDLELFSQRAAFREQLVETYYEHTSGRISAPPMGIWAHVPLSSMGRRMSE